MRVAEDEYQALASSSRAVLLSTLRREDGPMAVDELAAAVGLHVNTTREHLDRLVAAGLVARAPERRTTRGRPRILYRYRERPGAQVRAVIDDVILNGYGKAMASPATEAAAAGRRALDTLETSLPLERADDAATARSAVVTVLERLGFDPEVDGETLLMRACPVEQLAKRRSDVVCAAGLGMATAMIERIGHLELVDAAPRVGDSPCFIRLREMSPEGATADNG